MSVLTTRLRTTVLFAVVSVAATPCSDALADEHGRREQSVVVWARAFFAEADTAIRVDSQTLAIGGTLLDLETDLGIDDSPTLPMLGLQWWFAERHALDLAYFELTRDGRRVIDFDIRWDDFVYPVNFDVRSFFDARVTRLAYRYSLVSKPQSQFSIGGGIHITNMEAGISEPNIGSSQVTSDTPLPMFTAAFDYDFSSKWTLLLVGEWFGIEIGDASGELWHADATLQWHAWKQVSLELGYNFFDLDFDEGDADFRGLFSYTYKGPFLGVAVAF